MESVLRVVFFAVVLLTVLFAVLANTGWEREAWTALIAGLALGIGGFLAGMFYLWLLVRQKSLGKRK